MNNQQFNPAQREVSDAWLSKYEQAYQKAQLLFGGTQDFINIQDAYKRKLKEIKKKKWQLPLFLIAYFGGGILLVSVLMILF